jgi:hypothetical protein
MTPNQVLISIARYEGIDAAMSSAKRLGFTKQQAWKIIGAALFKIKDKNSSS